MKAGAVFHVLLMCIAMMVVCVLTIDATFVHESEMKLTLNKSTKEICAKYINGDYDTTEAFASALTSSINDKLTGSYEDISVAVPYANSSLGIVDVEITYSYHLAAGENKTKTFRKTFIKECYNGSGDYFKPYIRSIDSSHYRLDNDTFVAPDNGGLASNSIWRTNAYSAVLDSLFSD